MRDIILRILSQLATLISAWIAGNNWSVLQTPDIDAGPMDYGLRVGAPVLTGLGAAGWELWRSRNSLSTREGGDPRSTADVDSIAALAESKVRSGDIDGLKQVIDLAQHEKHRGAAK